MEKDDDHVYKDNVDVGIEKDMGSGERCSSGQGDEVSALVVFGDGVRVGGEDVNEDGSEYAPSSSLHCVHKYDSDDVSQWP